MNFAFKVSDRIVFMESGRILYDVPPERIRASGDVRVKDFLKHVHIA